MNFNPEFWFVSGLILIILEVVMGFTIVLLFASLAAFTMGFLVYAHFHIFESVYWQFAAFFAITCAWAAVLWGPIKRFKNGGTQHKTTGFENYLGQTVEIITADLAKGKVGSAKWSGTTLKVMLHPDHPSEVLKVGETARVVDIRDNTFIVR